MWGGRLRPYIHPRKIRRRRADSDRGGARKRPAPVAVVRGHPEGKRRREPTRSKGPGICREAGPGVNGRGADFPPLSRSVLPAVPATQTVKPAACQDPLCPLALSCRLRRRTVVNGRSSPYMVQFSMQKIAEIMVQRVMKITILINHDFFPAYMGVFWSEATAVFSTLLSRVTRVLKTVI